VVGAAIAVLGLTSLMLYRNTGPATCTTATSTTSQGPSSPAGGSAVQRSPSPSTRTAPGRPATQATGPSTTSRLASDIDSHLAQVKLQMEEYLGAPQYLGFLIEHSGSRSLQWGGGLAADILSPLPKAGKPLRNDSDTALYNRMIYGKQDVADQVVPPEGEALLNFGLLGVPLLFGLIGLAVAESTERVQRARSTFDAYVWQYIGEWAAYAVIVSALVVSQIFIYFFWPIYVLAAMRTVPWGRLRPGRGRAVQSPQSGR